MRNSVTYADTWSPLEPTLHQWPHKVPILRQVEQSFVSPTPSFSQSWAMGFPRGHKTSQGKQLLFAKGSFPKGDIYEPLAGHTHKSWGVGTLAQQGGLATLLPVSYGKSEELKFEIGIISWLASYLVIDILTFNFIKKWHEYLYWICSIISQLKYFKYYIKCFLTQYYLLPVL